MLRQLTAFCCVECRRGGCYCQKNKTKLLIWLFCVWENWVEQCLLSLIITRPLLFTSVLWLHCLQPLKDFGRQKRSGLGASIWYNSQVTALCGTGFLTPRVNRRIRRRECYSWGGRESVVEWLIYRSLFCICTSHAVNKFYFYLCWPTGGRCSVGALTERGKRQMRRQRWRWAVQGDRLASL